MSPMTVFELAWHIDATIVCATALGLLCRQWRMQPVAQVARICSGCRRVTRGSGDHGRVTEEIVVMRGRRGDW